MTGLGLGLSATSAKVGVIYADRLCQSELYSKVEKNQLAESSRLTCSFGMFSSDQWSR